MLYRSTVKTKETYRLFGYNCATFAEWLFPGLSCTLGHGSLVEKLNITLPWKCACKYSDCVPVDDEESNQILTDYATNYKSPIEQDIKITNVLKEFEKEIRSYEYDEKKGVFVKTNEKPYTTEQVAIYCVAILPKIIEDKDLINILSTHVCFLIKVTQPGADAAQTTTDWYSFGGYPIQASPRAVLGNEMVVHFPDPLLDNNIEILKTDPSAYAKVVAKIDNDKRKLAEFNEVFKSLTSM